MVTVHRAHGFQFAIFVNDHSPPHVHVFGKGGEAKISWKDRKGSSSIGSLVSAEAICAGCCKRSSASETG
jgi:hypothetical protein